MACITQDIAELMEWISGSYNVILERRIWIDEHEVVAATLRRSSGTLDISRRSGATFNGRPCVIRLVGVGLNGCAKTVTVSFNSHNYDFDLYVLYTDQPVGHSSKEEIMRLVAGIK